MGQPSDVDLAGGQIELEQSTSHFGRGEHIDRFLHHLFGVGEELDDLGDADIQQVVPE